LHRNSLNHQVSTLNFLDLPGGSAVFQKGGIIGEARIQPQAALQRNLAFGFGVLDLNLPNRSRFCICESSVEDYDARQSAWVWETVIKLSTARSNGASTESCP
jgi:uncharacterized protein (DUF111 family)